jgi:hypothetical protein
MAHLDSTSFHVDGEYALEGDAPEEEGSIHITYGSKYRTKTEWLAIAAVWRY